MKNVFRDWTKANNYSLVASHIIRKTRPRLRGISRIFDNRSAVDTLNRHTIRLRGN